MKMVKSNNNNHLLQSYGSVGTTNYDDDDDVSGNDTNEGGFLRVGRKKNSSFLIQSSIIVCTVSILVFLLSFLSSQHSSSSSPSSSLPSAIKSFDSKTSKTNTQTTTETKNEDWIGDNENSLVEDFTAGFLPYEEELFDLIGVSSSSIKSKNPSAISNENNNNNSISGREDEILPLEQVALIRDHGAASQPFSTLNPVSDLKVFSFDRPKFSRPGKVFGKTLHMGQSETGHPLPSNSWYENMVLLADEQYEANLENRIYTVPYVVNADGPIPGIKLGSTRVLGMDRVVQITYVDQHGLTMGAAQSFDTSNDGTFGNVVQRRYEVFDEDIANDEDYTDDYNGEAPIKNHSPLTPLGLTIKWVRDLIFFCFIITIICRVACLEIELISFFL